MRYYFTDMPRQGEWSVAATAIDKNFNITYQQLLKLEKSISKFCGLFPSVTNLQTNVSAPEAGMYAYVNDFVYDPVQWANMTTATYDPTATYYTIYIYNPDTDSWVASGVTDGSVTTGGGSSTDGGVLEEDLIHNQDVGAINKNHPSGHYDAGTKVETILRDILYRPNPAVITLSSASKTVEVGTNANTISITFTIAQNDAGDIKTLTVYDPYKGSTVTLANPTFTNGKATVTYTSISHEIAEGKSVFKINATFTTANCDPQEKTFTVSAYYYYYYGYLTDAKKATALSQAEIKSKSKGFFTGADISNIAVNITKARTVFVAVPTTSVPELINGISKANVFGNDKDSYFSRTPSDTPVTFTAASSAFTKAYHVYAYNMDASTTTSYVLNIKK